MHDPTPNNFWFDQKYYWNKNADNSTCPEDVAFVFMDENKQEETDMTLQCMDG